MDWLLVHMTDDMARIILLAGFAVVVPIGAFHRVRSHTGERLDRRQEGWRILLTLRPFFLAFMAGLVAFLIEPSWMAWSSLQLPSWARSIGVGLGVVGGGLLIWTFFCLGHNLTDTVVTRCNASPVTHGPYRWVRHPLYLAFCHGGDREHHDHSQRFLGPYGDRGFFRDCCSDIRRGAEAD